MRSENVHLEEKFVFIPDGKTKTARRNVPLTEKAAEVISRRMKSGQNSGPKNPTHFSLSDFSRRGSAAQL
jgi:integrase